MNKSSVFIQNTQKNERPRKVFIKNWIKIVKLLDERWITNWSKGLKL